MPSAEPFLDLCASVRFELDVPVSRPLRADLSLADMVARVRSHGLMVTPNILPDLSRVVDRVEERLGLSQRPEVYVINDPSANAFAPAFGQNATPVVILHSGLVSLLSSSELQFVIGHELGHLGLRHGHESWHTQPSNEFEALQARSSQRYAEVSADRVGLVASRSLLSAASVMIKLASGLPSSAISIDVDGFISQLERRPEETSRDWELHQTHPAMPLRVWSLLRFSHTDCYDHLAASGGGEMPIREIDAEIAHRLGELGEGRLSRMESEVYESALMWSALMLIIDDGVIDRGEQVALKDLLGKDDAKRCLEFAKSHGGEAVAKKFEESLAVLGRASRATQARFREAFESFAISLEMISSDTKAGKMIASSLDHPPSKPQSSSGQVP